MPKPPQSESLTLAGPAGDIEALLETPSDRGVQAIVVVCHPHPLHGGTLQNKVTHTLSRAFLGQGFAALRFNFRGVAASAGSFDDGNGEVEDVLAAVACLRERYPGLPLWLAGFSFGAAMSIRAALHLDLAGLVSIAPAAFRFAGNLSAQPDCPWLIVHGEDDELVPIDESVAWADSMAPGPELLVFAKTSHYFHGKLVDLRKAVGNFIGRQDELARGAKVDDL